MEELGVSVCFVSFEQDQSNRIQGLFDFIDMPLNQNQNTNIDQEVKRLEVQYAFTLTHILHPHIIQRSSSDRHDETHYIQNFLNLENIVSQLNPELILRSQGTMPEFYFADRLAEYHEIPQATQVSEFFGRDVFFKRLYNDTADLHEVEFNSNVSIEDAENFISDQINSHRLTEQNIYSRFELDNNEVNEQNYSRFRKLLQDPIAGVRFIRNKIKSQSRTNIPLVSNSLKKSLYTKHLKSKYILLTLHKPGESTEVWRAHPFVDTDNLVRFVSRNLPHGTRLYVREHPNNRRLYSYTELRKYSDLPNVRVLDPRIDIHKAIENSECVMCMNNTTGYESLMNAKPVISLSPSPYASFSESVYVSNQYNLDTAIAKAMDSNIQLSRVTKFIRNMLRYSIDIPMGSTLYRQSLSSEKVGREYAKAVYDLYSSVT
jgi:hypothetical protein